MKDLRDLKDLTAHDVHPQAGCRQILFETALERIWRIRQSGPESDPGFQVRQLETFCSPFARQRTSMFTVNFCHGKKLASVMLGFNREEERGDTRECMLVKDTIWELKPWSHTQGAIRVGGTWTRKRPCSHPDPHATCS